MGEFITTFVKEFAMICAASAVNAVVYVALGGTLPPVVAAMARAATVAAYF